MKELQKKQLDALEELAKEYYKEKIDADESYGISIVYTAAIYNLLQDSDIPLEGKSSYYIKKNVKKVLEEKQDLKEKLEVSYEKIRAMHTSLSEKKLVVLLELLDAIDEESQQRNKEKIASADKTGIIKTKKEGKYITTLAEELDIDIPECPMPTKDLLKSTDRKKDYDMPFTLDDAEWNNAGPWKYYAQILLYMTRKDITINRITADEVWGLLYLLANMKEEDRNDRWERAYKKFEMYAQTHKQRKFSGLSKGEAMVQYSSQVNALEGSRKQKIDTCKTALEKFIKTNNKLFE